MSPKEGKGNHQRRKVWKPKVRSGCITCRIRRVKCDEEKPSCRRCTSTGRQCDGYPVSTNTSQQRELVKATRDLSPTSALSILALDSQEQESLFFFRQRTSVELSGWFDNSFWRFELLQASHLHPSIRYSVIALGAMHKKMISGSSTSIPDDEMDSQLQFALKQSNRAIKEILQHSARETLTDKINMLTHCILFRSLACIQGHTGLALEHLRSGLRILREVDEDLEANPDTPIDHPVSLYTLRALLVNMDIQAREIMTPAIRASWEPQPRRDFRTTNTPFQNISQARSYFEAIFNDAIAFMQVNDMTPPFPEEEAARLDHEICRLQSIFQTGSDNLGEFLSTVGISVEREALMGIQMIYHHIRIFMKAFERAKGVPQSQFILEEHLQMLVNLAGEALGAPPDFTLPLDAVPEDYAPPQAGGRKGGGSSTPGYSRPVYFCVSGTCSALWAVCAHTRDRALRRKALGLLLHYPRREGTWDSVLTGRVAWDLMRLEENCAICGGSGSPVNSDHSAVRSLTDIDASDMIKYDRTTPDCHTVVLVNIEVTGRRAAMLTYRTVLDDKLGQPGVVKEIVW